MSLPHFDVTTFPSQILWLFIAAGMTYVFNKFLFLPSISSSITKRQKMLDEYKDDTVRMQEHIANLKADIIALNHKGQVEIKTIIEEAITQSQAMLLECNKNNNLLLTKSISEYDQYLKESKSALAEDIPHIVEELKSKLLNFISRQNI
jgi:F0F1-type ATP synthase membrane subunit b/b'